MSVLGYIGVVSGSVVIITPFILYISLKYYSKIKLVVSDFLRLIGFIGKWARKKSIESELEGTLNGVINDLNRNFSNPILPSCKIEWVTKENQKNIICEDSAIICLSFDKRDHDLNFYNATFNFIQTGLCAKAKPFIKTSTKKAIDLVSTKLILKRYRRNILSTFNAKFSEIEQETKDIFHRLDETEKDGLFSNLLLPEVHHLGEILFEKTPTPDIENEIERFLNWFYELATREIDDKTNLRFESPNIKIGVILVAKIETYEAWGAEAYTKWAEKYASEHYTAVYLLSRGYRRHNIVTEIADILIKSKGFEQVNKKTFTKTTITHDNTPTIITCICLRPDIAVIRYNAWAFVKKKFDNNEKVVGIIETVNQDNVIVNVSGLQCLIINKNLSTGKIVDATKQFREEQELELNIIRCEPDSERIELSNSGTITDPQKLIDANLSKDTPIRAKVLRIQKDKENFEKGIIVKCETPNINVFIPRSKMTYSRFTTISNKFHTDDDVQIILDEFNYSFGNYIGRLYGLKMPWETEVFTKLKNGNVIEVVVKLIQERFLICEVVEGLECILLAYEISWDQSECNTNKFKIDETLKVKVISIDSDNRKISVSLRQFSLSPVNTFFNKYSDTIIDGTITGFDNVGGLFFKNDNLKIENCHVNKNEIAWCKVSTSDCFSIGDKIKVKFIAYDIGYDSIQYSCKQVLQNQFQDFVKQHDTNDFVEGKICAIYKNIITVEISYNGLIAQAYIYKTQISNYFINESDIPFYLPIDKSFYFSVENIYEKWQVIELSRKNYLLEIRNIELGSSYIVNYIKTYRGKSYFYSNDLEGFVMDGINGLKAGDEFEVIPISTNSDEFAIG